MGSKVTEDTATELLSIDAYNPTMTAGVRIAVGDVDGDGTPDVVTARGKNVQPYVRVFSGAAPTDPPIREFLAYGSAMLAGVFVAAGDVTGDGKADIVTGPGPGGGPTVRVFDSNDTSAPIGGSGGFRAYGDEMTAGVRVGAVDVDGDGRADVLTAPGGGHVVTVKAFNAADLIAGVWQPAPLYAFDAYPSFTGGAFVSGNGANWVETLYTWDHRNRLTAVTERDANGRTTKEGKERGRKGDAALFLTAEPRLVTVTACHDDRGSPPEGSCTMCSTALWRAWRCSRRTPTTKPSSGSSPRRWTSIPRGC